MSATSRIEWTDKTWNPVRGCALVSKGCTNCYAMKQAHRFAGAGQPYEGLTKMTSHGPVWTGHVIGVPEVLDDPLRWKTPARIFVNSMSDLFHEDVPFDFIDQVFGVMAITTRHTYQILTKRPERMYDYIASRTAMAYDDGYELDRTALIGLPNCVSNESVAARRRMDDKGYDNCGPLWPLENVWLGVSVEDQAAADDRIRWLLSTRAAVRWLSCEPLLGPLTVPALIPGWPDGPLGIATPGIDWVVCGGESGPGARPMHPDWARSLRDQCQAAGVPFFFKQWGDWSDQTIATSERGAREAIYLEPDGSMRPAAFGTRRTATTMQRNGKKATGRKLDGVEHNGYPATAKGK